MSSCLNVSSKDFIELNVKHTCNSISISVYRYSLIEIKIPLTYVNEVTVVYTKIFPYVIIRCNTNRLCYVFLLGLFVGFSMKNVEFRSL